MADSQRKTANLFDGDVEQGTWNAQITPIVKADSSVRCRVSNFIDVAENTQYTISLVNAISGLQIIVVYVDDNYSRLSETTWLSLPITFNTPTNCKYVEAIFRKSDNANIIPSECGNMMLNSGSTPLPYEPYWLHSLRKLTTATEAVENPLYSDGTAITSYTLKGNTVQNGTPTPSNPVEVQGVGERTENLFGGFVSGVAIDTVTGAEVPSDSGFTSDFIAVDDNAIYSYSGGNDTISTCFFAYDNSKAYIGRSTNVRISSAAVKTVTTASSSYTVFANNLTGNTNPIAYIRVCHLSGTQAAVESENIMLNSGSTAKPYEPYSYKIPISSAVVTTNIDLGGTQTVRQIKKYTFTGNETFSEYGQSSQNDAYRFATSTAVVSDISSSLASSSICTHFTYKNNWNDIGFSINNGKVYITTNTAIDATSLKQWLAAQYANGTPVAVYYVLATPETAAVNEPLMKIGDYADTLSNAAQIPTTEGANSITVDTTVQPSEFTATWTGWHNAEVKIKLENLFDYQTMSDGVNGQYLLANGDYYPNEAWKITDYIPCNSTSVTLTRLMTNQTPAICGYDENKQYIAGVSYDNNTEITLTSQQTIKYIRFSWRKLNPTEDISQIMLNSGSTALPYEPYWK